jgi:DNA-binding CsgD family transcriptional regulator
MGPLILPELAEAAARSGATADLATAREWIELRARLAPTPWCLGIAARVRALADDGPDARRHYAESVEQLGRSGGRTELARSHLLFGEWLRRRGARAEAREHLRVAHAMFEEIGAAGFAARAGRELRALGDQPSPVDPGDALTAQERQIAELAAEGLTNPEIATKLFLSPRTVQYHLRKVFIKLAIGSRVELRDALAARVPSG